MSLASIVKAMAEQGCTAAARNCTRATPNASAAKGKRTVTPVTP